MNAATPQPLEAGAPERTLPEVEITVARSTDKPKDVLDPAEVFAALLKPGERSAVAWQGSGPLMAKVGPAEKLHLAVRDDLDMWFTPNATVLPVDERRKGTAEEISRLSVLPSDIDHRTERKASAIPDLPACYRIIGEFERRTGLYAPISVETGGGLQYMVQIDPEDDEATLDNPGKRERAQRLARRHLDVMRAIAAELHPGAELDSVANLDRLHRMPGTRNHKYAHRPLVLARRRPGRPYTMSEVEEGLARVPVVERPMAPTPATAPSSTVTETDLDAGDRYVASVLDGVAARLRDMQARAKADPRDYDGPPWDATVFRECCTVLELANSPWNRLDGETALNLILDNAPRDVGFGEQQITDKWRSAVGKVGTKGRPKPQFHDGFGIFDTEPQENAAPASVGVPTDDEQRGREFAEDILSEADVFLRDTVVEHVLRSRFVYSPGLDWQKWTSKRWENAAADEVIAAVSDFLREYATQRAATLMRKMGESTSDKVREEIGGQIKALKTLFSARKIGAVVGLTRGKVLKPAAEFDTHTHLVNTQNGVVDLRTGEIMPHDPELYMRRIAGAEYRPGYAHPAWTAAMGALPSSDHAWMQERLGQAATGEIPDDDTLVILRGGGSNGKTTLLTGAQAALGEYATLLSRRALLTNPNQHPTELMDLMGARLAVMEELPEDHRLDVTRIKDTVGAPSIKARRMHKDPVEFTSTHTLFVTSNYLPQIDEVDLGTWRRLVLVEFPYTFRRPDEVTEPNDRPGDPRLRSRVKHDPDVHAAALAWIVDGARRWYAGGRIMSPLPARVQKDTGAWRRSSDLLLGFLDDTTVPDPGARVLSAELLDAFNRWLAQHNLRAWGDRTFASRLKNHDEIGKRLTKARKRGTDGLSRDPITGGQPLNQVYPDVWVGLRFLRIDEEGEGAWTTL
ncbi:phage/plasmid primase, P4 family [Georgenia sp. MJ173]|uniref:DNA primase family protein n=1 Tax=Georgenia sunbinii TaxID=3117728 RepID=UPI002F26394C